MSDKFVSFRTNDIVRIKNDPVRYLVTNVRVSAVKGIVMELAPIGTVIVTVGVDHVQLDSSQEAARREGRVGIQRLQAGRIAHEAWEFGVEKAHQPTVKAIREPFTIAEIQSRIKTAIHQEVKPGQPLTQERLDQIVRRVTATQAYLVGCLPRKRGRKSRKTIEALLVGWQEIASEAVRIGNAYNRALISTQDRKE